MNKYVNFYCEFKNGKYKFDKKINYTVFFRGCFCPPHKGHFNVVYDIIKNNPNVKVIINQIGNARHGVPYKINRKIWKIYIENLLPKDRILLSHPKTLDKYIHHPFLKNTDKFIIIKGYEDYNIKKYQKNFIINNINIINEFKSIGIDMEFYIIIRQKIISATLFSKSLIDYKKNKICICNVIKFMPNNLPQHIYKKIIYMLISCNLKI